MKVRNSVILFILFVILAGISYYLMHNKTSDKISEIMADRDFAVQDINRIQKIFLADRRRDPIVLEKINGVWMLNGKHKVLKNSIDNLLHTIKDIRVQSIPSRGHTKSIMEGIAVYGIKVEIYAANNEKLKTYYVGGTNQSDYGTYFYMEHGTQPYIMEIPHFVGELRSRFDLDTIDWRDKTVFDIDASQIQEISVEYPRLPNQSFVIENKDNNWELLEFVNKTKKLNPSNVSILKSYVKSFEGIIAQDIQNANKLRAEAAKFDPYCTIRIRQTGIDNPVSYKIYPMSKDTSGKVQFEFDQTIIDKGDCFRLHIERSDGDFLLVQYPNVQAVLRKKEDFLN